MTLDLRHVDSFLAAADTLNFSTAADRVGRVQSAISQHIAQLEEALGVTLFDRGRGKAMALTPEGQKFLIYANRLVGLVDEAAGALAEPQQAPPLRLGVTGTLALSVLPEVLTKIHATWSNLQIEVGCERSRDLWEGYRRGRYDAILCVDQGPDASRRDGIDLPLAWVCGSGFTLNTAAPVPLLFLTDAHDLRRFALAALERAGRPARIETCPDPIGLRALVLSGRGLTVWPAPVVTPPLRRIETANGLPDPGRVSMALYARSSITQPGSDALFQALLAALQP